LALGAANACGDISNAALKATIGGSADIFVRDFLYVNSGMGEIPCHTNRVLSFNDPSLKRCLPFSGSGYYPVCRRGVLAILSVLLAHKASRLPYVTVCSAIVCKGLNKSMMPSMRIVTWIF